MSGIRLRLRRGEEPLLQLRFDRRHISVGSGAKNDVIVPGAPTFAARIEARDDGRYRLLDRTSSGAVRVRGAPLSGPVLLTRGEAFELGGYELELEALPTSPRHTERLRTENVPDRCGWLLGAGEPRALRDVAELDVGTEEDNHVVLRDPFVSRYHCRLHHHGGQWRVADLGSTNGTWVNDLRVREAEVPFGARIRVGSVELVLSRTDPREVADLELGMVAASEGMRKALAAVRRFADLGEPVVIVGASGTGKEGVARALHDCSARASGPFVALNCGALAESVIESELFGHVRGAFTGADRDKKGAFEAASGGTLFLDEIGELPLNLQPKLLRVLETRSIRRVGATTEVPIDLRVLAATHRDLAQRVRAGAFREDLFHRLFVLSISIPPLAERPEDIGAFAAHFLRSVSPAAPRLTPAGLTKLRRHPWPGNVRELRNVLVRAVLESGGEDIRPEHIEFASTSIEVSAGSGGSALGRAREERDTIAAALRATGGNRAAAARRLGISKSTFYDRARRMGL